MKQLLLILCLLSAVKSFAQSRTGDVNGIDPTVVQPQIFQFVEQMPSPAYSLIEYLSKNIHYPDTARERGIEGRVVVKFVINEDGSVSDAKVMRGIGYGCDEEAVRVIKNMPPWKPGKQNGKAVKVYYTQPIAFKLETEKKVVESGPTGIDPGIAPMEPNGNVQTPQPPKIYSYVEQMPSAPYEMNEYLAKNVHYPKAARKAEVQGRVIVQFVVNEDGSISDAKVLRGIGAGCDEEALRVIRDMPKWKPAKQNGKAVKVFFTQPISFRLE